MKFPRYRRMGDLPRPKPFQFYPPKLNRVAVGTAKLFIARSLRRSVGVTHIDIRTQDLEILRSLRAQRCLVTPSHSGGYEPHILMALSKQLHDSFHYVAAMELFARSRLHRWILQRLGVYSIIRGVVDRSSFSMTREILASGRRWLVIFPEGEAVGQNSLLMPFQQGVFQLGFKAYEDAARTEPDAHLYIIPLAIRYLYLDDMHQAIDTSLARLEQRLALQAGDQASRYDRLRRVADVLLATNERVYRVAPPGGASFNDRINHLKDQVLLRLERQLNVATVPDAAPLDRVRALFNAVDRVVEQSAPASDYERAIMLEQQTLLRDSYHDLWRALRFVAIYDGYIAESMNVERFMDVLSLLEWEVCKHRPIWGPRKACVRVAPPVDLKEYYASYQTDRRATVQRLTADVENTVRGMLAELERDCQPLRLN